MGSRTRLQTPPTLLLSGSDVRALLDMDSCIAAVADAFRARDERATLPSSVLGTQTPDGTFHVKVAGLTRSRSYYAAKINANYPDNPARHGLPSIQGVVSLHDATNGVLLALLDSIEITTLRTAAATAVAARYLARAGAGVATIIGCGTQGRSQLRALTRVRAIHIAFAYDSDPATALAYAAEMSRELDFDVRAVSDYRAAVRRSDIVVTCTPARAPLLAASDVPRGVFIAAVGADGESKQELEPSVLAIGTVVVDVLEQCATIGELHHALAAGVMRRDAVHAELAEVVSGRRSGRTSDPEVTIFDSTGTALEDVAAAALVYERALAQGRGQQVRLAV
ncbi:MAG: ornithine cyclodeaminase family protein [Gemmatimonadota bacterium]|nr:ornithine cyclodeaminase family protein [Gemmatimonadota bacterium]